MQKLVAVICVVLLPVCAEAQSQAALLLRYPTVSSSQIVFTYAGDLWTVARDGGEARRLTSAVGADTNARFSPDGSLIAFTGMYAGNEDVYVIPADGGQPKRLTFHPSSDVVVGWTPDGRNVIFQSNRHSYYHGSNQLFEVPAGGGFATALPLPIAEQGAVSPDGSRIAYVPHGRWQAAWKRYRGGQTTPVWVANLKDSSVEKLPRENSNDFNPIWVGNTIYFLSDRNGPVSLFAYDTSTKQVREAVSNRGLDFKSASAGSGAIVIEQFGVLKLYDIASGAAKTIDVRVHGDLPELRPQFVKVEPERLHNLHLSPAGVRVVAEAWGEIFTLPSDKGDIRNLTHSPAVADRDPAWSPDGKWICYFSDEPGEYELQIREQNGMGAVKHVSLGQPPSFFYSPLWSPDSSKIAYTDKRLNLWYLDVGSGKITKVDTDRYDTPARNLNPAWSPDSKWLTYTKQLPNHFRAVFVYSLDGSRSWQVSDGMSDAEYAIFDKNGKYLYFTASTDVGLASSWLDMSSLERPQSRSVYVAVLRKEDQSPLAPESDEEKIQEVKAEARKVAAAVKAGTPPDKAAQQAKEEAATKKDEPVVVRIDIENIGQRVLALPIPARNYLAMVPGASGTLFLAEASPVLRESDFGDLKLTIQKFDLSKRKVDKYLDEVSDFVVSSDGSKLLYRKKDQFTLVSTLEPPDPGKAGPPKPGEGPLKLDTMEVFVEPRAMWKQMFHEAWRVERDFLYDPNHHGLDLAKAEKRYAPYLDAIGSRDELNYLLEEALGELSLGHVFVGGGYRPPIKPVKTGLLGADYTLDQKRYRVARVYNGENWNPDLQAPLTQPGVNVVPGEYILSVNGRELHAGDDIDSLFEGTAGKQVLLKVGPRADGTGSRDVTVVPVESETGLRRLAWIEGNRRKVDELSKGRVAYVHLPNTAGGGFSSFNRYYFAQVGKQAAILDERFNEGGDIADYIIDYLRRPLMSLGVTREGERFSSPGAAIYGPKVMIINEMAGSGGDAQPWYFRRAGIGPLVGKRTWGGLVGIWDYPDFIDGGGVTAPRGALYGLEGEWEVEGRGIAPDYEVDLDPAAVRQGHDPQLEKAVDVVLDLLAKQPPPQYKTPAYPNYHSEDDLGVAKTNGAVGKAPVTPDSREGTNVKVPGKVANATRKRG
jgi:tricorn protease